MSWNKANLQRGTEHPGVKRGRGIRKVNRNDLQQDLCRGETLIITGGRSVREKWVEVGYTVHYLGRSRVSKEGDFKGSIKREEE